MLKKNIYMTLSEYVVDLFGRKGFKLIDKPAGLGKESRHAIEASENAAAIFAIAVPLL